MFIKVLLLIFKVLINEIHKLMFCSFRWRYLSLVRLFAKPIIYKDNTIEISTIRKHKANKADKIAVTTAAIKQW